MIDLMTVERILFAALDRPAGPERVEFLDEVCGRDADLRHYVESLLASHSRATGIQNDEANSLLAGDGVEPPSLGVWKRMKRIIVR